MALLSKVRGVKRLLNHTFNLTAVQKRFQIYSVFYSYYNATLWDEVNWANAVYLIKDYLANQYHDRMGAGLKLLENISAEAIAQASYDYYRLFVGPDKLLAPPYESAYRNPQGLLMQKETLKVRDFYKKVGLRVAKLGSEPDDHLALELELVCYLLAQAVKSRQETALTGVNYLQIYWEFYQEHLQQWIFHHCEDVLKNSATAICRGMALVLKGFMELEKSELNSLRGGNCLEQTM